MAIDHRLRLQLAVNPAIALFHSPRIPRHVQMKQIRAMRLQVQPFAGGVGGQQNPHRMLAGIGIKRPLDRLAFVGGGGPPINRQALVGAVGIGQSGL